MYDEKTFNDYIFWLKVKRIVLVILFSIAGAVAGIVISDFIVNILGSDAKYRILITVVSTLIFFAMSLLCTTGTGEKVQEGYWKMAMLRKLTIISKKLDILVDENDNKIAGLLAEPKKSEKKTVLKSTKKSTIKDFDAIDDDDDYPEEKIEDGENDE
jgi:hypothetical protein